jgi:hypothetical protein
VRRRNVRTTYGQPDVVGDRPAGGTHAVALGVEVVDLEHQLNTHWRPPRGAISDARPLRPVRCRAATPRSPVAAHDVETETRV